MIKRGFTLVELSIVLIIIGILIGGILAARSMITTSKIQSVVKEIQQYDAMVVQFKSQYGGLPGDVSNFNGVGNNDGILDATCNNVGTGGNQWSNCPEIANFWLDLQKADMGPPGLNFTTATAGTGISSNGNTVNVPHLSYDKNAQVLAVNDAIWNLTAIASRNNNYMIGNYSMTLDIWSSGTFGIPPISVFTPADALAIDIKMDDGSPFSGIVKLSSTLAGPTAFDDTGKITYAVLDGSEQSITPIFVRLLPQPALNKCVATGVYNVNEPTAQCDLMVQMLSQTGDK